MSIANLAIREGAKGFTLAEVLITLGVIGVVAAMTLPTLIKEYQKHVLVNQLKVNYSLLNHGFKKMIVDEEGQYMDDINGWPISSSCTWVGSLNNQNCISLFDNLKKYFKINVISGDNYKYKYLNSNDTVNYAGPSTGKYAIALPNNSLLLEFNFYKPIINYSMCDKIKKIGGHTCSFSGHFLIDVNGEKKPNTFGRDIFMFFINENGAVIPAAGKEYNLKYTYDSTDQNYINKFIPHIDGSMSYQCRKDLFNSYYNGAGCSGYLIDYNDWKMDY